jgi:hypothetical protein
VTPDEAKARLEADKAKLHALEGEIVRLASTIGSTPVMVAMMRTLIEMVCSAQGPNFTLYNKLKFYEGVVLMLRDKGIT